MPSYKLILKEHLGKFAHWLPGNLMMKSLIPAENQSGMHTVSIIEP